jgi:hypothetical protein
VLRRDVKFWPGLVIFDVVCSSLFSLLLPRLLCDFIPTHSYCTVGHSDDNEKEDIKQEMSPLDQFGDCLDQDQEDLPEEFRLTVER